MIERELLELVELCYASVAQPKAWSDFLRACERAFQATVSTIAIFEMQPLRMTWSAMHGLTAAQEAQAPQWTPHDPRAALTQRLLGPGEAYSFDDSHDIAGFKQSAYYLGYQREIDILWAVVGRLGEGRDVDGVWALHRPERAPCFDARDTHEVAVLARHLGRARRLQLDLEAARAETDLRRDLLDRVPLGLLLLAADGRIVEMNLAAKAMLAQQDGLNLVSSALRADDDPAQRGLAAMIHAAGKGLLDGVGGVLAIPRRSEKPSYIVSVARCFAGLSRILGVRAAVVVSIADPARKPAASIEALRKLWDLTVAEAQVALALAGGMSVRNIAARNGVSYETVRGQLKRVLAKSGTHQQSELVSLILMGAGSVMPGG